MVLLSVILIGSLWIAGNNSPWSPNFDAKPLPEKVVGTASGPVFEGAKLFHAKGCLNCHLIDQYGGRRGPDLTYIGDILSQSDIVIRIVNGGVNMPAFGNSLKPEELSQITAFLQSRKRQLRAEDQTKPSRVIVNIHREIILPTSNRILKRTTDCLPSKGETNSIPPRPPKNPTQATSQPISRHRSSCPTIFPGNINERKEQK